MNRKQKVLTVIALIAFVVIGVCHYLAWPPIVFHVTQSVPYTEWKQLTYDEAKATRRLHWVPSTEQFRKRRIDVLWLYS